MELGYKTWFTFTGTVRNDGHQHYLLKIEVSSILVLL